MICDGGYDPRTRGIDQRQELQKKRFTGTSGRGGTVDGGARDDENQPASQPGHPNVNGAAHTNRKSLFDINFFE